MSFTPLVDAWHDSEETRSRLRPGRRWYRMEKALGDGTYLADMTPNRHHWRHRETLDEETPGPRLWRFYEAPERAEAEGIADTDLVDEFTAEFTDTRDDEPPDDEHGPASVREHVDRARDAIRTGRVGATEDADDPHSEERREQLTRWHGDDEAATTADDTEAGWAR